jgi:hypothetical protein
MPPFLHDIDDISISAIPSSSATRLPAPDAMPQIDANWINMDIIQSWVRLCNDTHKCMEPSAFGSGPTWLIDVQQECLASAASLPADTHYCALSYVWGQAKTSKLTTGSAKAFQQPGALSGKQDAIVPTTIRHAIGLVRLLGERYLWVDAFCIAQDDEAHFHTELRNMGTIYNRAYLTIVAATAWDANDGLRGLMNVTPKRKLASNFADDLHKYLDPDYMIWVC